MKQKKAFLHITAAAAIIASLLVVNCNQKPSQEASKSMVIVYASGTALVVRDGKELPAKVGMIVSENDVIKTEKGTIDVQSKNGSAVRIREMTTLTVASLAGEGNNDTRLQVDHGTLLANVKKSSAEENFSVVTPTAIAGVRGTTFEVQVFEDMGGTGKSNSSVRVIEGKVAMSPRFVALEEASEEEIASDPALQKLSEMATKEVVLEDNTMGTLDPELESAVAEINNATKSGDKAKVTEVAETASEKTSKMENLVTKLEAEASPKDLMEKETLEAVDAETLDKIASGDNKDVIAQVQEERAKKQEAILKQIEEEASKKEFKSVDEIKQHYQTAEKIVLTDGTVINGAVVAQTGNLLIVHTPQGVKRISKSQVASQTFL